VVSPILLGLLKPYSYLYSNQTQFQQVRTQASTGETLKANPVEVAVFKRSGMLAGKII